MLLHAHYDPAIHGPIPADALAVTHRAIRATAAALGDHPLNTEKVFWRVLAGEAVEGLRRRADGVVDTADSEERDTACANPGPFPCVKACYEVCPRWIARARGSS